MNLWLCKKKIDHEFMGTFGPEILAFLRGWNGAKWAKFLKLALNPPKSAKRIKQTCSTPFWGDVGIKKWSPFFYFDTRSAIICHLETDTFAKSDRFQMPKYGTSGAKTKKRRSLFNANIPTKLCRTRLFYAFSTFGWALSQLKKIGFLAPFHPLKMTKLTRVRLGA